jgi:hypothetical protein
MSGRLLALSRLVSRVSCLVSRVSRTSTDQFWVFCFSQYIAMAYYGNYCLRSDRFSFLLHAPFKPFRLLLDCDKSE